MQYEETTRSCTLPAHVNLKIFYSQVGLAEKPQQYIVKVEKDAQV